MKRIILGCCVLLSSCTFGESAFVCEEGQRDGSRVCVGGVWVSEDQDVGLDQTEDTTTTPDSREDSKVDDDMTAEDMPKVDPVCPNGVTEEPEECDDNNAVSGDGCSDACILEPRVCGDGVLEAGEICDDGDTDDTGPCSADCSAVNLDCERANQDGRNYLFCKDELNSVEASAACESLGYELALIRSDIERDFFQQNATELGRSWLDGTDLNATVEYNWRRYDGGPMPFFLSFYQISEDDDCVSFDPATGDRLPADCDQDLPYVCEQRLCGNGAVNAVTREECDDGNVLDDDGCSSSCELEPGFACEVSTKFRTPTVCRRCGDGIVGVNETCDDGNVTGGDGCDEFCQIEGAAVCSGEMQNYACEENDAVIATAQSSQTTTELTAFGATSANVEVSDCGDGVVTGLLLQVSQRIRGVRAICGTVDPRDGTVAIGDRRIGPLGANRNDTEVALECPPNQALTGYIGFVTNETGLASAAEIYCSPLAIEGSRITRPAGTNAGTVGDVNDTSPVVRADCAGDGLVTSLEISFNERSLGGNCREFTTVCAKPQTCE